MPSDPQAFIEEHKGKDIDAIVEQVRDGTQIRVRLLLDDQNHQFINLVLAGAKSPRAGNRDDSASEPFGDEAKTFTETRILQRAIKVRLLSAPLSSLPLNQKSNGNGLPALPSAATGSSVIIGMA